MNIEPEELCDLADSIETLQDNHEQIEVLCGVLDTLEKDYELTAGDFEYLGNVFFRIAESADAQDPCNFLGSLRKAMGLKYERYVGRR